MKSNKITWFLPRTVFIVAVLIAMFSPTLLMASGSAGGDAYLGVYTQHLNKMLQNKTDYDGGGLYVEKVERRSPADNAGIQAGDVILMVDKKEIRDKKDLKRALWKMEPGDKVKIIVWRNGKKREIKTTLGDRYDHYEFARLQRTKTKSNKYHKTQTDYYRNLRGSRSYESGQVSYMTDIPVTVPGIKPPRFDDALARARATEKALRTLEKISVQEMENPNYTKLKAARTLAAGKSNFPIPSEGINNRMAVD